MTPCDKRYSDGSKCGRKAYKDQRCFPHWNRTVPRWFVRQLDRDLDQELAHSAYVHACPANGTCWLHIRRPSVTDLQPNVTIDEPMDDPKIRAIVAPVGQECDPWDSRPIDLDRVEKRYPKGFLDKARLLLNLDSQSE